MTDYRRTCSPLYRERRVSAYKDHYTEVSPPEDVTVGSRKGMWLTFVDESKEENARVRHVCKAYFKFHRYVWTWTLETFGEGR